MITVLLLPFVYVVFFLHKFKLYLYIYVCNTIHKLFILISCLLVQSIYVKNLKYNSHLNIFTLYQLLFFPLKWCLLQFIAFQIR